MMFRYRFPRYVCFQTRVMFPICRICLQSNSYVSNILSNIPCFQYPMHVSTIHFLFPNADDVSNVCFQIGYYIHRATKTILLSIFWKLLFIIRAVRALKEQYLCHLWSIFDGHAQPTLKTNFQKILFSRDSVAQKWPTKNSDRKLSKIFTNKYGLLEVGKSSL